MIKQTQAAPEVQQRQYQPPQLKVHGCVSSITLASGPNHIYEDGYYDPATHTFYGNDTWGSQG